MSDWLDHAEIYMARYGFAVIPMGADKRPLVKWKSYQERLPTVQELRDWDRSFPEKNIAIITGPISKLVVVDCESREDAEWFYRERGQSPTMVQTRRGFHLYFRHPGQPVKNGQRIGGRYDVRADGGYVLAPPSTHKDGRYKWVEKCPLRFPRELPPFKPEWRPETAPVRNTPDSLGRFICDGAAYIKKIVATAGQGGHNATFQAAVALRDSGMSEGEALLALMAWNETNADPPWSDAELLHKIRSAFGWRASA